MESTPNQLDFYFLPVPVAIRLINNEHPLIDLLRGGHGVLSRTQFARELSAGAFEILALPNDCAALICWGTCSDGRVMNILTTVGSMEHAAHALMCIEAAARYREAQVIMSVGHVGWSRLVKLHGYEVTPRILMKKVLQ